MPNSIALASKMAPLVDLIYKAQSASADLDTPSMVSEFSGVNEIKVLKVSTTGLGAYSTATGYPKGDVTAAWETLTLAQSRGKQLSVDRIDNEETLGKTFGTVTGNFMRDWVIPELDAYRFAKYASASGVSVVGTPIALDKTTILAAIDEAVRQMDADEVPAAGRRLYINSNLKPALNASLTRMFGSDGTVNTVLAGYNDMPIKFVPASRFYSQITLNDGSSTWGYAKTATTGKDINFMIVFPEAVVQVPKFVIPKVFDPDTNQIKDEWMYQFRLYHDAFVYDNKAKGVYVHKSTT